VTRLLVVMVVVLFCASVSAFAARPQAKTISPAFIRKADKWCATVNARVTSIVGKFPYPTFNPTKPDLKTLPLVGKHFAKALSIRRRIPAELRSVGEPTSGKRVWDAIRSLALEENAVAIKQVAAALASNSKVFVSTVHQTDHFHSAIGARATAAGFPQTSACGKIF
jgi:hypothetical protein